MTIQISYAENGLKTKTEILEAFKNNNGLIFIGLEIKLIDVQDWIADSYPERMITMIRRPAILTIYTKD